VEKLCYVLWRPPSVSGDEFRDALVGGLGPRLLASGTRALTLLVADAEAEALAKARITRMADPPAGMLSVWLEDVAERHAVEAALATQASRFAGYLVRESVPLPNTSRLAPRGTRTPGTTMLALLEQPERLAFDEWIRIWHGSHSPLAIEIQCTYRYVRNVVERPLTPDAPPWRGLVEEGFPSEAVSDLQRWYRAEGDPAKTRERMRQMIASVQRFLDLDRIESHPLGEYVLRAPADPQPS
jgi:hypothetical protein